MQFLLPYFSGRISRQSRDCLYVLCAQETVEIAVRRHPRARRYTLRVSERSRAVAMTIPARGSMREARAFAERNAAWIAERLQKMRRAVPLADGETVPLRGVPHRIAHRRGSRGTVWTDVAADGSALLCVTGRSPHIARRILEYLKREAKRELVAATRRHAGVLGVEVTRIGIRDTSSRWGSCSSDGALSYSWRLILAPPYVLDYLAAHEVAHRRELNHSVRFWRVVDRLTPERHRAEAWLKSHGNELHRYGMT